MSSFQWLICTFVALFLVFSEADHAITFPRIPGQKQVLSCPTIFVDQSGRGNFETIQAAIDSIPLNNNEWICIHIKQGTYREKVLIPFDKPYIYLNGEGSQTTIVDWNDHDSIATSATFTSQADNIIAKDLTFINSYNYPLTGSGNPRTPALAAMIEGDKSVFYGCAFVGLQDTLWDVQGRHYFKNCIIQGAVDFIFGSGQSHYEQCTISVVAGALNGPIGFITAQGRSMPEETNGFVFKDCVIEGNGKTFLGRPWRSYARVVFYNTTMTDVVVPEGWNPWDRLGHEDTLTFDEFQCRGPGSDTSRRVNWANKLNGLELQKLIDFSFIDNEGWLTSFGDF